MCIIKNVLLTPVTRLHSSPRYVQFKKVPGGNRSDCQIVNGAVCTKNVADRAMAMRLTDPQILLVASTIDYQRGTDNKLLSFDNLLLQVSVLIGGKVTGNRRKKK